MQEKLCLAQDVLSASLEVMLEGRGEEQRKGREANGRGKGEGEVPSVWITLGLMF